MIRSAWNDPRAALRAATERCRSILLRWCFQAEVWWNGGAAVILPGVRFRQRVRFRGQGTACIGSGVLLGDAKAGMCDSPLLLAPHTRSARIDVAADSILANGVELLCRQQITIGEGTLIGAGTRILDSHFHCISRGDRLRPDRASPVSVGNEVWIGMGATLLKGVRIEDGAIVGAGSVVRRSVGRDEVVAGNPAKALRREADWKQAAGAKC